jgi:cell division protein FtsB
MMPLTYLKLGAAVAIVAYLVWWGDAYGLNARRVAKIERDLIEANARIKAYSQRDDQAEAEAEKAREAGYHQAMAELASGDTCIVSDTMARALGRIVR